MINLKQPSRRLSYWQYQIFRIIALSGVVLGLPALLFSLKASLEQQLLYIVVLDITAYVIWCLNAFIRWTHVQGRTTVFLILLYALGISLLLTIGPYAGALNWLLFASLLTTILLKVRALYFSLAFNTFVIIVLYFLFYMPDWLPNNFLMYTQNGFLAVGVNFIMMNTALGLANAFIINRLNKTLIETEATNEKLIIERQNLAQSKRKAEESDRLKSAFLANMSHEIRTPLNGMLGFLNLLNKHSYPPEKRQEFLHYIEESSHCLIQVIDDIITLSEIDTGQVQVKKTPVAPEGLLSRIFDYFQRVLHRSNSRINLKLLNNKTDSHITLHTDFLLLEQVIRQLLSNAAKFTLQGSITIGWYFIPAKKSVLFFVADTGIGIAKNQQQVIFERFRKSANHPTQLYRGTGLGLSICKELTQLMDGQIWVHSKPAKGSTFFILLPIHS